MKTFFTRIAFILFFTGITLSVTAFAGTGSGLPDTVEYSKGESENREKSGKKEKRVRPKGKRRGVRISKSKAPRLKLKDKLMLRLLTASLKRQEKKAIKDEGEPKGKRPFHKSLNIALACLVVSVFLIGLIPTAPAAALLVLAAIIIGFVNSFKALYKTGPDREYSGFGLALFIFIFFLSFIVIPIIYSLAFLLLFNPGFE